MKAHRLFLGLIVAAGVVGAQQQSAFAQAQPRQESPLIAARKQITDAMTAAATAKKAVDAARLKVLATYKAQTPDYAKAEAEVAASKVKMDAARIAALNAVKASAPYRQALAAKDAASQKIREAQEAGGQPEETVRTTYMQQATVMSRMESQGLESNAAYAEAKAHYAEAQKALEAYKAQLDEFCKADPEYAQADQAYTAAQQAVQAANDNYKQVQQSEAAARAAARTTAKPPSGSGGTAAPR